MNATIDAKGTLLVSPETPVEAFALSQWSEKWWVMPVGDSSGYYQKGAVLVVFEGQKPDLVPVGPELETFEFPDYFAGVRNKVTKEADK